jgi:hypothetical protein
MTQPQPSRASRSIRGRAVLYQTPRTGPPK